MKTKFDTLGDNSVQRNFQNKTLTNYPKIPKMEIVSQSPRLKINKLRGRTKIPKNQIT